MSVGVVTHASPAVFRTNATEGYLTQPNVLGAARVGWLSFEGALNLEGYTLRRGELNAGIYGEGYIDRRHPHTLAHEAVLAVTTPVWRGLRASVAAGKGFAPFGTDDPMMRPLVKYPVNHHHAQVIERVLAVGALRIGDASRFLSAEYGVFNGDEPVSPFRAPQFRRFGDSHASRLTVAPVAGMELQASRAFVQSPGIIQGGAFDHTQSSVSWAWRRSRGTRGGPASASGGAAHSAMSHEMEGGGERYVLAEFARTDEGFGANRVFRFNSVLAEGLLSFRRWGIAMRAERTERPESERLLDPFRTANGHIDFQIIGITRWSVGTVQLRSQALILPKVTRSVVTPFIEVSVAQGRALRTPAVFVPREFYGANALWSMSVGGRLHAGRMRDRMGRYGVLRH